ncbi:hypothetical protein D1164_21750 [Mariniphaga sediminis]|uniref:Exo-alpha-sialidase n=1 Tax=Mariniphaga sediminis TaxID=1628158 RepID=A0A399CU65_9BACT|nr:hypothetical protein [Mariniphaga sediminis]RIH63057.1 hypothetical protein D1164_21750 [Mariniphaga sediminis]
MNRKSLLFAIVGVTILLCPGIIQAHINPEAVTVRKIWSDEHHNAFTGLLFFKGNFYCSFRQGKHHASGDKGVVRVIKSQDGIKWESVAVLEKEGYDLRDPKLSVTPQGKIMIIMGGSVYKNGERQSMLSHVSFSDKNGNRFSSPVAIKVEKRNKTANDWMWRVTWHHSVGYAVLQRVNPRTSLLFKTRNGRKYKLITDFSEQISGGPGESTVRISPDGEMFMMARRRTGNGLWGRSEPPYLDWEWSDTGIRMGGPDFVPLNDSFYIAGTRVANNQPYYTGLFLVNKEGHFTEIYKLPSGGDNSYPGIVVENNKIYVSYYSSHEGNASIYFAEIPVSAVKDQLKSLMNK